MAATPGGLVGEDVVVEVRCPFTGRIEMIEPGAVFPFLEGQTSDTALKRSNSYFDQVQGQMFVTNKSTWDKVVSTHVVMKVVRLDFDSEYCKESVIPESKLFYDNYHEKYVAENSESSCFGKQMVKCCEIIIV